MRDALASVDVASLPEASRVAWAELSTELRQKLDAILATRDVEAQRAQYSGLSNALYRAVKTFGAGEGAIYWQHCPMARNNFV